MIGVILDQRDALNLSADQEQRLRAIRAGHEKDVARRQAEIRIDEVDLREFLAGQAPDLSKVESLVKRIAAMQGELRFRRIQVHQAGLAVLTPEQRRQFDGYLRRADLRGPAAGTGPRGTMGPRP